MKYWKFLVALVAAVPALFACTEKEDDVKAPSITLSQTTLSFEKETSSQKITVTSTRDWKASTDVDWISIDPASGKASDQAQEVTVTVLPNSSYDRTANVTFEGVATATLAVNQAGSGSIYAGKGTVEDPYNVAAALNVANNLKAYSSTDEAFTDENSATVYVKGIISEIELVDISYGNATYYISDDGKTTTQLEVYRGYFLDGAKFSSQDQIKVGDEVIVYGTLVNFKGNTPEFTNKNRIHSLNGKTTSGGSSVDYTKCESKTVADFISTASKETYYKLKGTVSGFNAEYCSFDLTDATGSIYVYSVDNKADWVSKVKNGGTVELAGLYDYYADKSQHEVVRAQILSYTDGTPVEGELMTIAQMCAAENKAAVKSNEVLVVAITTKGYVAMEGTSAIYVFESAAPSVKVGDKVTFSGTKDTYNAVPEITSPVTTVVSSSNKVAYPEVKDITSSFASYTSAVAEYVTYTAKVVVNGTYTNFVVEGVTELQGALSSVPSSISSLYAAGDKVQITGFFNGINTTNKLLNVIATEVKVLEKGSGEGGDTPGGDIKDETFASNVKWTLGNKAFTEKSTVNGVGDVQVLKLGNSSTAGTATIVLPKGTKSFSFYGVSWKNKPATLSVKVGETEIYSQPLAANAGATNKEPYTLTVSASDHYTKTLDTPLAEETTITVTTSGSNTRVILFGIKAE